MITCTRRLEFDAGHRVPLHESKCKTPHGHRYVVEITCEADALTPEGFVVDFGVVKQIVGKWIDDNLDHTMIYQTGDELMRAFSGLCVGHGLRPFYEMPVAPTAENIARELLVVSRNLLADRPGLIVRRVVVHETPNCQAAYEDPLA